jgi:predicted kinase
MAAQWAPRQLSGERLVYAGQLLRAGAFVGAGQPVLVALLANAEDREAAAALAADAGIALPPPSPPPK